ncbi:MAG TPA: hypothetical protein VJT72_19600 [Pseudonocardiaceae bacterium]|nr:hypothetical protein [Pseudonocardiaceae bacterium]
MDLECFDRIYLNGWVPTLQVPGQVVSFLTQDLGFSIPSPAILERIGLGFCKAVVEFAAEGGIPVVRFVKGDRKLEVMRPHLDRLARAGRSGVAAIGVATSRMKSTCHMAGSSHMAGSGCCMAVMVQVTVCRRSGTQHEVRG